MKVSTAKTIVKIYNVIFITLTLLILFICIGNLLYIGFKQDWKVMSCILVMILFFVGLIALYIHADIRKDEHE